MGENDVALWLTTVYQGLIRGKQISSWRGRFTICGW